MKIRRMLFCFGVLLILFSLPTFAEENESMPDGYRDFLSSVPDEFAKYLPDGLFSEDPKEVEEGLSDAISPQGILDICASLLGENLPNAAKLLSTLLGILLLSALSEAVQNTLSTASAKSAFSLFSILLISAGIFSLAVSELENLTSFFEHLAEMTNAAIPLFASLYLLGGNTATAVVSTSGLSAYLTVLESAVGKTILPLTVFLLVLSLIGAVGSFRVKVLTSTVKKSYTTFLSFLMMLLLAFLGMQTTLSKGKDTLAAKSLKFAAGSAIPVVGGSVSEMLRTVGSGITYLRSVTGVCGILLLSLLLLPTLLSLFFERFVFQITASVADLLSCDREKALLEELASLYGYLIAAVIICSSVPILSLSILLSCAGAVG